MPATALDDRRREVLRTLIQLHVDTGEPVGSESLSRAFGRALSPASLRSLMADLEALGYLDHPHTSAGRVPTDEGYRVYVDSLMGLRELAPGEAQAIAELGQGEASAEQTLERASQVLSRLSRNVGFVLAPDIARTSFRHVDLVPLGHPRVLVVMVSATGIVTHKVIEVEERLEPAELQDLSLVATTCRIEGEPDFGVGVLGSTRMQYAHVVSLVDHVARAVADVLRVKGA